MGRFAWSRRWTTGELRARRYIEVVEAVRAPCAHPPHRCGVRGRAKIRRIGPTIDTASGRDGEGLVVGEDDFDAAGQPDADVVQVGEEGGQGRDEHDLHARDDSGEAQHT